MFLLSLFGGDSVGESLEIFERRNSHRSQTFKKSVQDIDSGLSIIQRAVCGLNNGVEESRESCEFAISNFLAGEDEPGDSGGIEYGKIGPVVTQLGSGTFQEPDIKRSVVRDQNGLFFGAAEFQKSWEGFVDEWGMENHGISNSGKDGNKGWDG